MINDALMVKKYQLRVECIKKRKEYSMCGRYEPDDSAKLCKYAEIWGRFNFETLIDTNLHQQSG